jgi:hypothetical protein
MELNASGCKLIQVDAGEWDWMQVEVSKEGMWVNDVMQVTKTKIPLLKSRQKSAGQK